MNFTEYTSTDTNLIRCFKNVTGYGYNEGEQYAWKITFEKEELPEQIDIPIYFVLDSQNNSAFSHWVYESSTWLPKFLELQSTYPSCCLVIDTLKEYKKLFLSLYSISLDCIRLKSDIEPINYSFFHLYTSLNDKAIPSIYYTNLLEYERRLQRNVPDKEISILYLPRGTKENFIGVNNRIYSIQEELKEIVRTMGGVVYETDTTSSLEHQITLIRKAKTIILDYGSNLWVNGLFAHGSSIVCLNIGWNQHPQYPSLRVLWDQITQYNSIQQIFAYPPSSVNEEGVSVVNFHMSEVLECLSRC
jgi:capsular polysaccharide biosynthesis protein